jgi:phosphate-selective porin OprO/OprP
MAKTFWHASTAIVAAAVITAPASADSRTANKTRDQEIQELKVRLDRLEREAEDEKIVAGSRVRKVEEHQAAQPAWSFKNLRPTISSPDGAFELAFRGRFQLDFASFEQDDADMGAGYGCGVGTLCDLGAGTVFRRMRLGIEGKFLKDFIYEIRFEFGGTDAEAGGVINIARVGYTGIPNTRIHAGAIQPIFTLYNSTSSADRHDRQGVARGVGDAASVMIEDGKCTTLDCSTVSVRRTTRLLVATAREHKREMKRPFKARSVSLV